jgi:hypothetical protein
MQPARITHEVKRVPALQSGKLIILLNPWDVAIAGITFALCYPKAAGGNRVGYAANARVGTGL